MTKKEALEILIAHSFVFEKDVQEKLIACVPGMPSSDVEALGKLLASFKRKSIDSYDSDMQKINQMITGIQKQQEK